MQTIVRDSCDIMFSFCENGPLLESDSGDFWSTYCYSTKHCHLTKTVIYCRSDMVDTTELIITVCLAVPISVMWIFPLFKNHNMISSCHMNTDHSGNVHLGQYHRNPLVNEMLWRVIYVFFEGYLEFLFNFI